MKLEFFGVTFFILELVAVPLLALACLMQFSRRGSIIRVFPEAGKLVNLFFLSGLILIISILLSGIGAYDRVKVIRFLLKWVEIFSIAIVIFFYASDLKRFRRIWWLLLVAHALVLVVSLADASISIQSSGISIAGLRKISAYSATFLGALLITFASQRRSFFIVFLFVCLAAFLSLSRGAWLILGIFGIYYLVNYRKKYGWKKIIQDGLVAGVFIILLNFTAPVVTEIAVTRIKTSLSFQLPSNRERMGMTATGAKAFIEHPFTGVGAENFANFLYEEGLPNYVSAKHPEKLTPHNFFLQMAAETGLLGFVSTFVLFLIVGKMLFLQLPRTEKLTSFLYSLKIYYFVFLMHLLTAFIAAEFRFSLGVFLGLTLAQLRNLEVNNAIHFKSHKLTN